eukprot:GHVR01173660.1.p1 GENE.GHVR01173660.1~~GHVR01173660.1.p1  ORF type:complete len:131 (+),score=19.36 GHVR01173660.1:17-409(+)
MLDPLDSIHIKVKRKNRTYLLLAYPDQEVGLLKSRIARLIDKDTSLFRLIHGKLVLLDTASVKAQRVLNGNIVHLVYKLEGFFIIILFFILFLFLSILLLIIIILLFILLLFILLFLINNKVKTSLKLQR